MRRLLNFGGIYYVIKSIISFIHDLFNKRFMVNWINYLVHFKQQEISNQIKTGGFYSLFSFFLREIYMFLYERVKKVDVGAELTVVRIYIRETCRRDMHSLTFSREIYTCLYERER